LRLATGRREHCECHGHSGLLQPHQEIRARGLNGMHQGHDVGREAVCFADLSFSAECGGGAGVVPSVARLSFARGEGSPGALADEPAVLLGRIIKG
jgi:hypothetical protein